MTTGMDATELARWTRFAAKGGIGKCTAVQDCVAESPEDLMFLKDDEITVLMQLPGQPGRYLGYCEGVVGRFQGDHVHFHGKLKRPVMTKRASASAMSVASSPVPSVTPSPRMPLSPLTSSNTSNGSPLDRDSRTLSDPFDLELDAPPKTRRSEDTGSPSSGDGSRRKLTRGADDLPGLEMFLPRSRSGSRSRPTSRGQTDDERGARRRTRIVTPPQLQFASTRADSLDIPPSPPVTAPLSLVVQRHRTSPEKAEEVQAKADEEKPLTPASPEPLRTESPSKDVSSLYDGGSMRSSIYSTNSYRSSVFGPGSRLSAGVSDAFARLSQAGSDDGEIGMGIGLSMLQDMADDDDEDSGAPEALPSTPRLTETHTETEQRRTSVEDDQKKQYEEADEDEDEEDDEDDDGSYWDGADIYDSYRYSRMSVMTKNSRRKSRFSVMSRNSFADAGSKDVPPVPLDAETRLRSDSLLDSPVSPSKDESERRKHVPPPLTFVKSTPSSSALLSAGSALSPASNSNRTTADYSAGGSDMHSPLLHTNFASPHSSSSHTTSFDTDDGYRHSPASPEPSVTDFSPAVPSGSGSGAASTLRQRLEHEQSASSTPLPSPMPVAEAKPSGVEKKQEDNGGAGRGIVVEDDETVNVMVVGADENEPSSQGNDHATRDSVQSAVSNASVDSTATSTSDVSDVSEVMRKIEADLASTSATSSGTAHPLNIRSAVSDADSSRTPTSSDFSVAVTQPLRITERMGIRSAPSPDQGIQLATPPAQRQQLPIQEDAKPGQVSQLLRPEQALFLPHPNAPRPNPAVISGQRASIYGMPPVHEPKPQPAPGSPTGVIAPGPSLEATLRAASGSRIGPAGIPHRATIFGKTIVDLASADGPVAMVWSLSPFPPDPVSRTNSPAPGSRVPRRSVTASASPLSKSVSVSSTPSSPSANFSNFPPPSPVPSPVQPAFQAPSPSVSDNTNSGSRSNSTTNVIQRPNFSPRVGVVRPRSRSFSDFSREVPSKPVLKERASEEGSKPTRVASMQSLKEASGASGNAAPLNGSPLRQSAVNGSPPKRGLHKPSPLSRPENNAVLNTPRASSFSKGISSPLGRTIFSSSQTQLSIQTEPAADAETSSLRLPVLPAARNLGVRQVASVDNFKSGRSESPLVSPPRTVLQPIRRNSGPADGPSVVTPVTPTPPAANSQNPTLSQSPVQRLRRLSSPSSKRHERSTSRHSQTSSNSDLRSTTSPPPLAGNSSSSSPVQRSNSIKSKLSLSHLRIRHGAAKDSVDTQTPSPSTGPATPIFDFDNQPETVQVQDAEFEMIRPTMRRVSSEPMSEESGIGPDERSSLQRDSTIDSPISGSARSIVSPYPSTVSESVTEQQHTRQLKPAEDAAAHRTRELKWMSVMSSVPASQARKNRKVRRLVLDGVPSSVRYLVWSHLTDSKAKRIPGVYGQLGRRGRVAASEIIERDAARCFPDQPHLQDPKGPLVGLLQTYLTMVPDIEYHTSLSLVAGHLLLQSPEEDAFWTFTSMMDLHLRAYYSSKSVQMNADAITFAKAVELVHPQVAKKLFADLAIPPLEVCRIWFSSLFSTTLPQNFVNRIWDVYLCDGPSFLFRVALAVISCCRGAIESTSDRSAVLAFLARPEMRSLLPEDPEEFINLALAVKLKDDDIRKQRTKIEAELRKRTQSAHRSSAPRLVSSISLPRSGPAPPL